MPTLDLTAADGTRLAATHFAAAGTARGAVLIRGPTVTDPDREPLALIESGDWVQVDADRGVVERRKRRAVGG